eukprot:3254303-Prymnesium_polylepis.1
MVALASVRPRYWWRCAQRSSEWFRSRIACCACGVALARLSGGGASLTLPSAGPCGPVGDPRPACWLLRAYGSTGWSVRRGVYPVYPPTWAWPGLGKFPLAPLGLGPSSPLVVVRA